MPALSWANVSNVDPDLSRHWTTQVRAHKNGGVTDKTVRDGYHGYKMRDPQRQYKYCGFIRKQHAGSMLGHRHRVLAQQ